MTDKAGKSLDTPKLNGSGDNAENSGYRWNRTPEGVDRMSEGPMKHGGRKAEKLFYRGQSLEPHFPEMYSEILADQPELRDSIDAGGPEALDARRAVEAELLRRIWFQLVPTATSPKDLEYFSRQSGLWFRHAERESSNYQDRHMRRNSEDNIIDQAIESARGRR